MEINLPCFGISVHLERNTNDLGAPFCGTIQSDLHDKDNNEQVDAAMDAIESFILAMACYGMEIQTPAFYAAIETAVEACQDQFGD